MKQLVKKLLIRILKPVNARLGFHSVNLNLEKNLSSKDTLLNNFFLVLKQINFNPVHIVDIGANHGTWTREAIKYFPKVYYSLLEPQYWLKDSITDLLEGYENVQFYALGAGAAAGKFKFTIVNRDDSCSFRYSKEQAALKGFTQLDLPMERLDTFLTERNLPLPGIVKIDAEGLDLEVLKGSGSYLGKTEVFMVEAAVNNMHLDNTVLSVIDFLDQKGYRLFDITDINRPYKPPFLWLVELVFIKKGGFISNNIIV